MNMNEQFNKKNTVPSKATPWGVSDHAEYIAPGITFYSTPSHGGYFLDEDINVKVAIELKKATCCQNGLNGWYEEDCDWSIVVYSFPHLFEPDQVRIATETVDRFYPDYFNPVKQTEHK
jgi:hypothetical protein